MKKYLFFSLLALGSVVLFPSCEEDEGKLPDIEFVTGSAYTSGDKTVSQGETVLVGIHAAKTEDKDVLKTFNESVSYDGGAATSVENISLSGAQGDEYDVDIPIVARNQAGTEKYTFTVTNRDGLTNSVSLTLTVQ